jgi:phage portal protein BeeE
VNLLQYARRSARALDDGLGWPEGFAPYLGYSRPVNGEEKPFTPEFQVAVDLVLKRSGPIAALMFVRQLVFSEARFQFRQRRSGQPGELFGTADLAILEQPWPGGTTGDLLSRMIQDADLAGNSFWTIVGGRMKRLRPDWVTIVTGSRSEPSLYGDAIDGELIGYIYSPQAPGSDEGTVLEPHEVAHFAPIPDPAFQYRGMSWLTPVIEEIRADRAATEHKMSFFRNGATPRVAVSLDAAVKPELFERFVDAMESKHAGVLNAYKTMYLGGGADVTMLTSNLRDLDYKNVQALGESRLAAAAGVPSVIVGFSEGLQGSSLNAGNYASSRRRFADGTLRPLWRNAAGSLANLLNVPAGAELWYDDRDISFLREDRDAVAKIQSEQAMTIRQLVDAGYEPKSVIAAVQAEDWSLLTHTGLYSVQLQKPGEPGEPQGAAAPAAGQQDQQAAPGGQ